MSDPSAHSGNTQYIGNMPSSGGGGGGGTPNVAIAGTDASGLPIASPVLSGNDSLDNVTLIGGNTNTGFRSVVFGTNNTNSGDNSLVAGQANRNAGQKNIIGGENNNVAGYENGVSGSSNTIDSNSSRNGVSGANNSLFQSSSNDVSGVNNSLIRSSSNDVSGYNHILTNTSIQNRVSGNNHTLNNVVNSNVSGYRHNIAPLSGSGADYNDISGNTHLIRGDYNRVSGGNNTVQTVGANVHGTNHVVEGSFSDVNGESNRVGLDGINAHAEGNLNDAIGAYSHVQGQGNTAKFAQHVAGRYAVVDPTAVDTVPTAGQKVEIVGWGTDDANRRTIRSLDDQGNHDVLSSYMVAGTKVVGPQNPNWGTPTGIATKAGFDTATVTLEGLAERVKALFDMLLEHGLIGSPAPSPLLTDYTYIIPSSGSIEEFARSGSVQSYQIRMRPTGPTNTFNSIEIGFANSGDAYTVNRLYAMRSSNSNTAITENPATGVVTISAVPFIVPAGTPENPTWYWVPVSTILGPSIADFVLLVELAVDSPRTDWGSGVYRGLGWIHEANELLAQNLSSGIDFTGGESFGSLPPIAVKFKELSTDVLWLPFVGDSWIYGNGDGGGPWKPYGIEGRLNARWNAFNQPIAVCGYAKSGYNTSQSLVRLQGLLANFDCRAAVVQFNSLNNVLQGLPNTQCRLDWADVETAMGSRKILPLVGGGMLDSFSPGWFTAWKANSDWMVARNADTNVNVYDNLVNPTTGVITPALAFIDDSHPNTDGYDAWETDCNANMRAAIAGWGV